MSFSKNTADTHRKGGVRCTKSIFAVHRGRLQANFPLLTLALRIERFGALH